jgi:hypothetical protein
VAESFNARPAGVAAPSDPGETDPVFEVVGVSAREIVQRCSEIRGGGRLRVRLRNNREAVSGCRLLDFADISDDDFVLEAHRVLLGRSPSVSELERRLHELRTGASRMQILVRLALSPEGRRADRRRTKGVGLRTLGVAARAIETAQASSALAPTMRGSERAVRWVLVNRGSRSGLTRRVVQLSTAAWTAVAFDRRIRRRRAGNDETRHRGTRR